MMRANANGVLNLVKFAKTCTQLKGFIHVSSVAPLMTKDKTGEIKEELLEETLVGGLDKEVSKSSILHPFEKLNFLLNSLIHLN